MFHLHRNPHPPGREDGGDGEEEARRAAWQVQVQEDSKARVDESHKVSIRMTIIKTVIS